uniref:Serpin domain-containing protein n=1 Tax=Timema tahoe TaxID=61484 RepID=A0A7R9IRX8_9NEOP|nr:unnamed protein product [Timema tahoe]
MQGLVYALLLSLAVVNGSSWRYINKVDPYSKDEILFPSDRTSPFNEKFVNTGQDLHKKYQVAVEAIYGVAVRLKLFMDVLDTTNFLVSPLSVATAIGELLLGAQGQSRERLEWLLSTGNNQTVPGDPFELHRQLGGLVQLLQADSKQHYDGYTLEFASAFFVQPDIKIKPSYEHAIKTLYGVQVLPLNFSGDPEYAQNTINQWTSVKTKGKIQSVLPTPLPPGTSTILVNTVYFKSDWDMPFDPELTIPGLFHVTPNRDVKVQLMRGHFDLLYADSERLGCRLVALPYKKSEAAMFIILPYNHLGNKTYNIQQYMNTILVEDIINLISSAVLTPVTLALPKMTLKDVLSISEAVGKVRSKLNESDPPIKDVSSKRHQRRSTQYWREDRKSHYKLRYSYNHQYYYRIPVDAVAYPTYRAENDEIDSKEEFYNPPTYQSYYVQNQNIYTQEMQMPTLQFQNFSQINSNWQQQNQQNKQPYQWQRQNQQEQNQQQQQNHQRQKNNRWQQQRPSIPERRQQAQHQSREDGNINSLDLDMSGVSSDLRFRVDDIIHQVVMEVSEYGTEAAAVTVGTIDYIGGGKVFKVDSPFFFFIRHEATLASLFWGMIVDPTNGQGEYT